MEEEKFHGVDMLINRMQTHPEEFFHGEDRLSVDKYGRRWSFVFKEYFHDCWTESEKSRIQEALRTVRRMEFDVLVLKELMRDVEAEKRQAEMRAMNSMGSTIISANGTLTADQRNLYNQQAQNTVLAGALGMGQMQASPFGAVPKREER